jgi:dihydrofolate synthase / folylpolyglutamate synthase
MSVTEQHLMAALARLDRLTDWEGKPRSAMRAGLEPMLDLMERLGNPHQGFRSIHVAGTKGKGSVCALIEAGLSRAGLRVGRYASPHVEHITERISILGKLVDEADMAQALGCVLDAHEAARQVKTFGDAATWFNVLTATAFGMFKDAGVDWAVVEAGVGGRLDSTNVVDAEVAVVTNVGLEHTEVLGTSREAIAHEKVGILKPGALLVTTLTPDDPAGRVLQNRADQLGCCILRTDLPPDAAIEEINAKLAGLVLDYLGRRKNIYAQAKDTREIFVGAWLLDDAARAKARLPGRLERFDIIVPCDGQQTRQTVPVVLDGAHVPFNLEAVLRDLSFQPDLGGACVAIVAFAADKDAAGLLAVLARHTDFAIFTTLPSAARCHLPADLHALAASLGMASEAEPDLDRVLERASRRAGETGTWVLVTGSLYLVGALREAVVQGQPATVSRSS